MFQHMSSQYLVVRSHSALPKYWDNDNAENTNIGISFNLQRTVFAQHGSTVFESLASYVQAKKYILANLFK